MMRQSESLTTHTLGIILAGGCGPTEAHVQGKSASQRHTDILKILSPARAAKSHQGHSARCLPASLRSSPLRSFWVARGRGKSLVAQCLYFFEELPYLVAFIEASARPRNSLPRSSFVASWTSCAARNAPSQPLRTSGYASSGPVPSHSRSPCIIILHCPSPQTHEIAWSHLIATRKTS